MRTEQYITGLQQGLMEIMGDAKFFLPELILFLFLLLLIVVDLFSKGKRNVTSFISILGFLLIIGLLYQQWQDAGNGGARSLFLNFLVLNRLAVFLKMLFALGGLLTILLSLKYKRKGIPLARIGEYHTLIYGLILGAMLLTMGTNLLMIYLAIEIISICAYILTHFNFNRKSTEASLKYFLFGAVSSAVMLYGMSLLYGFTGTLDISSPLFRDHLAMIPTGAYYMAIIMTLVGFLFKLGAVPFHIWSPDVYEGAPTPIVALFSTVPKIAGVFVLFHFLTNLPDLKASLAFNGMNILALVAIASMLIGNLSALWQKNAKRMMAYSSIAHAGFMLMGVIAYSRFGLDSLLFYAAIFMAMNYAIFLVIKLLDQENDQVEIKDFAGWGKQYPFIGIAVVIIMISLVGLPPTAGFTAKLLIFSAVWDAYQTNNEPILLILFTVGLLNTVIALFYYIKIPYYMFFRSGKTEISVNLQKQKGHDFPEKYLLGLLVFPLLILFFKSDWLMDLIHLATLGF